MNQDSIDRSANAGTETSPATPPQSRDMDTEQALNQAAGETSHAATPPPPATSDPQADAGHSSGDRNSADLEAEISALKAKVDSHWDKVLRMNAEMENLRKRTERDLENAHRYALERFVAELLPVKDSMELGLSAASDGGHELAGIREGYELTLKMLASAMEKFKVEEINPLGEAFDPELHQAMTTQPADGVEPGTVINVVQKGYRLNQRLVRPAMVIVAK